MKITIDADHATELFYGIEKLISEGILRFTEDGIELTAADPAMVALIDLSIPGESFEEYEVTEEDFDKGINSNRAEADEAVLVGVNFENLYSVVSMFDEEITLTVEENELVLTEEDDRYTLPLLNLSMDDIPSMDGLGDHAYSGELELEDFRDAVDKLKVATDTTTFTFNSVESKIQVEGDGDQISVESSISLEDVEELDEDAEDKVKTMFSLDYLSKAEKLFRKMDSCDELELSIGEDFPGSFLHESDRENLKFVLAPRIEEN